MYDSPVSLQDCCIDVICENISAVCEVKENGDDNSSQLVFNNGDVFIHSVLSEKLLSALGEKGKLDDKTMLLFDSKVTNLKRVHLKNASRLTTKGLKTLKSHKITELEATNLTTVTINDLIGCLGEWTIQHLRVLNVAHGMFASSAKLCVAVYLPKLRNLHTLNVCFTEFNKHCLEIIATDLVMLENLDISGTKVKMK